RRLEQREPLVLEKESDRGLQEGARRDVVAVEDADQLAFRELQGVVQIAGLRVLVVSPRDVAHTDRGRERTELRAAPVVEEVDFELVARIVEIGCREHRVAHDVEAFVVCRDIDVDGRPKAYVLGQGYGLALERPRRLKVAQHEYEP